MKKLLISEEYTSLNQEKYLLDKDDFKNKKFHD